MPHVRLVSAIKQGDLEEVTRLLNKNNKIDLLGSADKNYYETGYLDHAYNAGNIEVFKYLLKQLKSEDQHLSALIYKGVRRVKFIPKNEKYDFEVQTTMLSDAISTPEKMNFAKAIFDIVGPEEKKRLIRYGEVNCLHTAALKHNVEGFILLLEQFDDLTERLECLKDTILRYNNYSLIGILCNLRSEILFKVLFDPRKLLHDSNGKLDTFFNTRFARVFPVHTLAWSHPRKLIEILHLCNEPLQYMKQYDHRGNSLLHYTSNSFEATAYILSELNKACPKDISALVNTSNEFGNTVWHKAAIGTEPLVTITMLAKYCIPTDEVNSDVLCAKNKNGHTVMDLLINNKYAKKNLSKIMEIIDQRIPSPIPIEESTKTENSKRFHFPFFDEKSKNSNVDVDEEKKETPGEKFSPHDNL